jgi:hypothetical protein
MRVATTSGLALLVLLPLSVAACHGASVKGQEKAKDLSEVYRASLVTYSFAQTYEDSGQVMTVSWYDADPKSRELTTTHFQTHFDRQAGFHFEFHEDGPSGPPLRGAAWVDGSRDYAWLSSYGPPKITATLDEAIDRLAGASDASSARIPKLLFGHLPAVPATAVAQEDVNGHDAIRFDLAMPPREGVSSETMSWWVDARSHLIVKTFARVHLRAGLSSHDLASLPPDAQANMAAAAGAMWVETTIEIEPIVNAPVSKEALVFHPPG